MQHAGLVASFPSACALGIATAFFSVALSDTVFAAFIRFYSFLQCSFCQLSQNDWAAPNNCFSQIASPFIMVAFTWHGYRGDIATEYY